MSAHDVIAAGLLLITADAGVRVGPARAAELDCLLQPRETVTVSAPVDGVVDQVMVDRGARVEKGAVLAVLESTVERHAVAIAALRAQQESAVKATEVRASFGVRRLERTDEMYRKNLVPLKDLDEAETAKIIAEYDLVEARENRALARLEHERAQAALELRTIRSPLTGVVLERLRHPGELAARDYPVVRIAQLNPLRAEAFAPIAFLGKITVGQPALVIPEPPMSRPLEASVTVVDPIVDAASGTFAIRLEMANPGNRIPSGLKCKVRFGGNSRSG
jgi:RND family efflux transporter MFP subunit